MENPFVLGYGKAPNAIISRASETEKIKRVFEMENPTYYSYILTGVRGCGKTVALNLLEKEFSNEKDWIVIDLPNSNDMLKNLAFNLLHCNVLNMKNIKAEINLSLASVNISLKDDLTFLSAGIVIEKTLEILTKRKKRVLICIDEISANEDMRTLISHFQMWLRKDLNVFLLMTGVYENVESLINDKVLTFLSRTSKIDLSVIDPNFILNSYLKYLKVSFEEAKKLSEETKGYAYAYQLIGYYAFEKHTSNFLEISQMVDYALLTGTYLKIWEKCKTHERNLLKAIANDKNKTDEICEFSKIKKNNFTYYKKLLIKKQLINNPEYGKYGLLLPRFKEIILKGDLK